MNILRNIISRVTKSSIWRLKHLAILWVITLTLSMLGLSWNIVNYWKSSNTNVPRREVAIKVASEEQLLFLEKSYTNFSDAKLSEHESVCRIFKHLDLRASKESEPQFTYRYRYTRVIRAPDPWHFCDLDTRALIAIISEGVNFEQRKAVRVSVIYC